MKVQIYEDNLMWGPRLARSASAFGHVVEVITSMPSSVEPSDVAVINLGSREFPPEVLVPLLKSKGIRIVAHAGHKEKDLQALGKSLNCDRLATNSELTNKIEAILNDLA